jgi:hypothetical protein
MIKKKHRAARNTFYDRSRIYKIICLYKNINILNLQLRSIKVSESWRLYQDAGD